MTTKTTFLALALVSLPPSLASAQYKLDEKRSAAPDGVVEIENAAGSIRVVGWSRSEVSVTGTLGARAEGLNFSAGPRKTKIEVEVQGNPNAVSSDIEVHVPSASRLEINSYAADIAVSSVTGAVSAETVNGSISVSGGAREVNVNSVQGSIEIQGPTSHVQFEAVNGNVTVKGVSGSIEGNTVNGRLSVIGTAFERAQLETVSGTLVFDGDLTQHGSLDAQTVSGPVDVTLPAGLSADVSLSTFSGAIENEFQPPAVDASRHHRRHREAEFTVGEGDGKVSIETLSGAITIKKRP